MAQVDTSSTSILEHLDKLANNLDQSIPQIKITPSQEPTTLTPEQFDSLITSW